MSWHNNCFNNKNSFLSFIFIFCIIMFAMISILTDFWLRKKFITTQRKISLSICLLDIVSSINSCQPKYQLLNYQFTSKRDDRNHMAILQISFNTFCSSAVFLALFQSFCIFFWKGNQFLIIIKKLLAIVYRQIANCKNYVKTKRAENLINGL